MSIDFEDLLKQAREGAPRSIFTPYMETLVDPEGFNDVTRLRLLGNAIANSPENASILAQNNTAITNLFDLDPLGLQILYNGTVGNAEFSNRVLQALEGYEGTISVSPAMKSLLGSIWESCKISRGLVIRLVTSGFVELILQDTSLETDPEIIKHFKSIYDRCQQISIEAETADEFDSLGIRVIGNISSHKTFGLQQTAEIEETPFTWETVILLGNLTATKQNIPAVLRKWPHMVEKTVELIEAEDPESEAEDNEEDKDGIHEAGDEEDGQPTAEPPFDLELWGSLLRNISRDLDIAREIAKHNPVKLFTRLLSSPVTQEMASDFASAFVSNCYDHDLTKLLTSEPFNGGSVLLVSSVVTGLSEHEQETVSKTELEWVLPRISQTLIQGMLSDPKEGVWIRGTRALAILKAKYAFLDVSGISKLKTHDVPSNSGPVKQNLIALE